MSESESDYFGFMRGSRSRCSKRKKMKRTTQEGDEFGVGFSLGFGSNVK